MPWLVCWVVSDLLRQEWLKGWKGNIQKWKESIKWSFWRNWQPRDRMGDADAYQARINSDAAAWLTRPCALSRTHMTRSHDWRDRVARKAPNDATAWPTWTRDRHHAPEITENAPSNFWSPFWPKSKSRRHRPEVMKWGNTSIQRELANLVTSHDLDLVLREVLSSLS